MGYGNKSIQDWVEDVHETAKSKGWDDETLNVPEQLALIHSHPCGCVYRNHDVTPGLRVCVKRCAEHGGETEVPDADRGNVLPADTFEVKT